MGMQRALSVQKVFFRHNPSGDWLFNDLNINCYRQKVHVINGASGCVKSTILQLLSGNISPQHGRISYGAINVNTPSKTFGIMPQEITIVPKLSVLENCILPFIASNQALNERDVRFCNQLLLALGMGNYRHLDVDSLSYQSQKLIMFVMAVVRRPQFLLLDDPFSGIDKKIITKLIAIITAFSNGGISVIITHNDNTHDQLANEDFYRYSMADGQIKQNFAEDIARAVA